MSYFEVFIVSLFVGLAGGWSSHLVWFTQLLRQRLENNATLSISRAAIRSRLALLVLTTALGGVGGAIAGTIAYSRHLDVGVLVAIAFAGGFAVDTLASRASKLAVG